MVESYIIRKLIGSFKNVIIWILRRTENFSNHFWRTNQLLDYATINQSIGKINHNLATIPKKRIRWSWLLAKNPLTIICSHQQDGTHMLVWSGACNWFECLFVLDIRSRRQIMANFANWLVESYIIRNQIGSFKNITICILRKTKNCSNHFWCTNQLLDDVTINKSNCNISHNLATISYL